MITPKRLHEFVRLLDKQFRIPFTKIRFGLDSIIGIIPLGGDFLALLLSLYPLFYALYMRLTWLSILKMATNILLDFFGGSIPLIGNLFDLFFKANYYNLEIIEKELNKREGKLKKG